MAPLAADEQRQWASILLPRAAQSLAEGVRTVAAQNGPDAYPQRRAGDDAHEPPKPFEGVRFSPQSGPGPSGSRPEHLQDMVGISQRSTCNRLLRAIDNFQEHAVNGTLPAPCRWILGSRLIFIKKKHGPKPRPIRVGELWKRVAAKSSLHASKRKVQKAMLEARQYGVSIPGGADILVARRADLLVSSFLTATCRAPGVEAPEGLYGQTEICSLFDSSVCKEAPSWPQVVPPDHPS